MQENIVSSIFDQVELERITAEQPTLGQRFVNFIVDIIVYVFVHYLFSLLIYLTLLFNGMERDDITDIVFNSGIASCMQIIEFILVYTLIEGLSKGRSLGKLITQTVAVKEDFTKITWKDAFIRTLCRLVPFEPVSMFSDVPWHDRWSKTTVIKKRRSI